MHSLKFKRIRVHNFLCFQDEELRLDNLGYVLVSGINHKATDSALSNGSGKSSIFSAICYALTGTTIQGLSDNIENIYTNPDDCWVELELDVDNDNFIIKRYKTPRQDLKIIINGIDSSGKGIRESSKLLSDYLPELNQLLLSSIIILGQGLPNKLTDGHPGWRKEKLEKLTKSDYLVQSIREKLDMRQIELKQQKQDNDGLIIKLSTEIDMNNKHLGQLEDDLKECSGEVSIEEKLNILKTKREELIKDQTRLDNEVTDLTSKVANVNESIINLTSSHNDLVIKETADLNKIILDISTKNIEEETNIKNLKAEIKKLDSITDVCPTCGSKLKGVKKVDTTELKVNLTNLENSHKDTTKALKESKDNLDKVKESLVESYNKNKAKLEKDLTEFNVKLNSTKDQITKNNNDLNDIVKEEATLTTLQQNSAKITETMKTLKAELKELDKQLGVANNESLIINDRLGIIQSLITLTKKEFRGVLLENVIKYIDTKVKQYSAEIFGTELLSFTLNENYIDIMYDNKYYEALSGGEKQKVDVIIQLAVRDLLSNQLGLHSNILVLDECLDGLDSLGSQKIIDLVSKITDLESLFFISHHAADLQISYDATMIVNKGENGCSQISIM